jgi:hypothetical protein
MPQPSEAVTRLTRPTSTTVVSAPWPVAQVAEVLVVRE